jgi:intein-encoded DNA endonuclease-like protein
MKQFSYLISQKYNLPIFRPHINVFEFFPEKKEYYIELLRTAGEQFAKNKEIEKSTLEEIGKDLISSDEYFSLMNNLLKAKIDDNKR